MVIMAVGWQVYHITGRVLDLGLIGLSQFLPFLCLVLFSGHVADQFDRRMIILLGHCAYGVCTLLLLGFAWMNIRTTLPIFASFGDSRHHQGISNAGLAILRTHHRAHRRAAQRAGDQLLGQSGCSHRGPQRRGHRLRAGGSTQFGRNSGAGVVYGAAAILLVAAITLVALIRKRRAPSARSALAWSTLVQGLHFVWHRKTVLGAISLDLFAVLFGGATALLPAYTRDVLHAGPEVFGYLRAAPGIGAGATAVWLAFRPVSRHVGVTMFAGVAAFGVATVVLGLTQVFWVAMVALSHIGNRRHD